MTMHSSDSGAGVCELFGTCIKEIRGSSQRCLVMKRYVTSLDHVLREGPLWMDDACKKGATLFRTLARLHGQGLLMLDVKPVVECDVEHVPASRALAVG